MRAKRFVAAALVLFLLLGMSAAAAAQDVYVVYSGKDRAFKDQIVGGFPAGVNVKQYNADLLALADYSGKQKVIAKLSRAKVILILGDKPLNALTGSTFASHLIVNSGHGNDLASRKTKVHAVTHGTDTSTLEASGNLVVITSAALERAPRAGDVFIIPSGVPVDKALAALVQGLLNP